MIKIVLINGKQVNFEHNKNYEVKTDLSQSWNSLDFYDTLYGKIKVHEVSGCIMISMDGNNGYTAIFDAYNLIAIEEKPISEISTNTFIL